ncbi:MAG TPA: ATP synthase subunit I [Deltaproteobacteria bacterium]|jgi:peptidoglycan biosynthesis protein MviN/MurJ (putative lipid II flippase)|nr:ATP synthase subunit I [Deltaproteobacteria bacterium]HOI08585.1 ATP synthase subunit I [Deltaproteobacteria bacterium]
MEAIPKEPAQKRIEIISLLIWISLCIVSFFLFGQQFALGVLAGGILCLINFQWLYRHAKAAVSLTTSKGKAFMAKRYILRLAIMAVILYALITIVKVDIIGLLLGLSVVILGITTYACFTYIFAGGE